MTKKDFPNTEDFIEQKHEAKFPTESPFINISLQQGMGQSCEEEVLVWVFPSQESKISDLEEAILALPIFRIDIPEKLKKWHQEVEKVASGGWEMASGGWVKHKVPVLNTKCQYCTILTLSFLLSDLYDKFLYTF